MSLGALLTHRVQIVRQTEGALDDYGQPIVTPVTIALDVPAAIQPRSAREMALVSQAGAAVSDHTIYLFPQDLTTADSIVHEPDDCPMRVDLPQGTYQVVAVPSGAGLGHHLEIAANLIEGAGVAAAPKAVVP